MYVSVSMCGYMRLQAQENPRQYKIIHCLILCYATGNKPINISLVDNEMGCRKFNEYL